MTTSSRARGALLAGAASAALTLGAAALASAHGGMKDEPTQAPAGMQVTAVRTRLAPNGALVNPVVRGFRYSPERLGPVHGSGARVSGEGHMHLFVDGKMTTLLVGPWTYVKLTPGRHTLRVTLNANDHGEYVRNGKALSAQTTLTVPKPSM